MIILLDLNYTLVANSDSKVKPFSRQVVEETYRIDLIQALSNETVILVTARPEKYRKVTLKSLWIKTKWRPRAAYFNDLNLSPPFFKERVLLDHLMKNYSPKQMLAVESNPKTRAMYSRYKVKSMTYDEYLRKQH